MLIAFNLVTALNKGKRCMLYCLINAPGNKSEILGQGKTVSNILNLWCINYLNMLVFTEKKCRKMYVAEI